MVRNASWGKFIQMLLYKAERAGRAVVKVSPGGLSMDDPHRPGLGRPSEPVERRPLLLIEGQVFSMKQEAPYVSVE